MFIRINLAGAGLKSGNLLDLRLKTRVDFMFEIIFVNIFRIDIVILRLAIMLNERTLLIIDQLRKFFLQRSEARLNFFVKVNPCLFDLIGLILKFQ